MSCNHCGESTDNVSYCDKCFDEGHAGDPGNCSVCLKIKNERRLETVNLLIEIMDQYGYYKIDKHIEVSRNAKGCPWYVAKDGTITTTAYGDLNSALVAAFMLCE